MTIEAEVANLTTATTELLSAVNVKKATLDASVATATAQAAEATAQAAEATTKASEATAKASEATAAAAQSVAARDLATAAWASATAPAETLAARIQTLHIGTVVDMVIDLPATHSDGGAWIDRCSDKSWYTETLGGSRWIGQQATIAAAWTAAGSTTGAVFLASATAGPIAVGKYYAATSATTATEVFRGVARGYPKAGVIWLAESARVVGYDLGTGAMWMVVMQTTSPTGDFNLWRGGRNATCVASAQGSVFFGVAFPAAQDGLCEISFAKDECSRISDGVARGGTGLKVSLRNSAVDLPIRTTKALVNPIVNDIAVTVLEGAPIDPATGLAVPTVAVATDSGVSVIRDNGAVVNDTTVFSSATAKAVAFTEDGRLVRTWHDTQNRMGVFKGAEKVPTASFSTTASYDTYFTASANGAVPQLPLASSVPVATSIGVALRGVNGLNVLQIDPSNRAKSMPAAITAAYNSGYQVGDSRLCALADTVAETITDVNPQADKSVKNNPLQVVGSLTKTAVAAGAQLVAYSGFSASNYLEQPYSANLDFGTGDFCVMGWVNITTLGVGEYFFSRGTPGAGTIALYKTGTPAFGVICSATAVAPATFGTPAAGLSFITVSRSSGVLTVTVNTQVVYSVANTENVSNAAATLKFGVSSAAVTPFSGSLALWRISATAPSADQIAKIYRDELQLFQPNAQCTIAGTSSAVTAMDYDDATDLLHVGTSYGRSAFKGLVRVESEATTVGTPTVISAKGGVIVMGGTNAKVYQPALQLRDELARKEEARRALGKTPVFFDFDATTGQTAFTLQQGYTAKAIYSAGTLKRLGSTKDYTVSNDGYRETINCNVAPGNAVWVSIMAVRSN